MGTQLVRSSTHRPRIATVAGMAKTRAAPAIRRVTAAAGDQPASMRDLAKEPDSPKTAEDSRAIQIPANCPAIGRRASTEAVRGVAEISGMSMLFRMGPLIGKFSLGQPARGKELMNV